MVVTTTLNQQHHILSDKESISTTCNDVSDYSFVCVQRDDNYDMYANEFLEFTNDEETALLAGVSVHNSNSISKSKEEVAEVCNTCTTVKFDSACSRCMSGNPKRLLRNQHKPLSTIAVKGFNGTVSTVDSVGMNDDGKREYYIQSK